MAGHHGSLELTWANKDRSLISNEESEEEFSYNWVDNDDFRVAEVRLLDEIELVTSNYPPPPRRKSN